jgi:hypothetical protein
MAFVEKQGGVDEIVGSGIPDSAWMHPSEHRIAPCYIGKGHSLYKEPLPPMHTLMVRPRGSAVGFPLKGLLNKKTAANQRPLSASGVEDAIAAVAAGDDASVSGTVG